MSRVEIIAGGRHVAVEGGGKDTESVRAVAAQALELWRATEGATTPPAAPEQGGPVGFHTELGSRPEYASDHQVDLGATRRGQAR